jgi:hypothetical protein
MSAAHPLQCASLHCNIEQHFATGAAAVDDGNGMVRAFVRVAWRACMRARACAHSVVGFGCIVDVRDRLARCTSARARCCILHGAQPWPTSLLARPRVGSVAPSLVQALGGNVPWLPLVPGRGCAHVRTVCALPVVGRYRYSVCHSCVRVCGASAGCRLQVFAQCAEPVAQRSAHAAAALRPRSLARVGAAHAHSAPQRRATQCNVLHRAVTRCNAVLQAALQRDVSLQRQRCGDGLRRDGGAPSH